MISKLAGRFARPARVSLLALLLAGMAHAAPSAPSTCKGRDAGEWFNGGIIYGVVPPLFGSPPLRAVTAHLDAIAHLGADAIWLSPLYATNDPSEISYAITDEFHIRKDFGTAGDLHALVKAAHARGLKVLLDFVPNHVSDESRWFVDAERRGRKSPYFDWFVRDAEGHPAHYFDWEHLENLAYRNPSVRKEMISAFVHWIRDFDVDGFRVDAAWAIRRRYPAFWSALRQALDRVKPHVFLLAEASARDPFYLRHGFDAAYDWTRTLGHASWGKLFDRPEQIAPALDRALENHATPMQRVFRFLDDNDTGKRFITRHGVATTKVAAVLLMTLPGIPLVYDGDEVGAAFRPYDDPKPLSWADPHHLRPLFQKLAHLRHHLEPLRCGSFHRVAIHDDEAAYAYVRRANGKAVLVVLNFGKAARLKLHLPVDFVGRKLRDALTGREISPVPASGIGVVRMAGSSALVLTPLGAGKHVYRSQNFHPSASETSGSSGP